MINYNFNLLTDHQEAYMSHIDWRIANVKFSKMIFFFVK